MDCSQSQTSSLCTKLCKAMEGGPTVCLSASASLHDVLQIEITLHSDSSVTIGVVLWANPWRQKHTNFSLEFKVAASCSIFQFLNIMLSTQQINDNISTCVVVSFWIGKLISLQFFTLSQRDLLSFLNSVPRKFGQPLSSTFKEISQKQFRTFLGNVWLH